MTEAEAIALRARIEEGLRRRGASPPTENTMAKKTKPMPPKGGKKSGKGKGC